MHFDKARWRARSWIESWQASWASYAGRLTRAECRSFPLKGATLAAMADKDLSLRDFADLDFIVSQHRLADAQGVLCSQGYLLRDRSHDEPDAAHADEPNHVFVEKIVCCEWNCSGSWLCRDNHQVIQNPPC